MKRNTHIGRVWDEVGRIRKEHGLPERVEGALVEAAFGYQVRNPRYRVENEISDVVASRDLKRLCDLGYLKPVGEKRGRYYVADATLMQIPDRTREFTRAGDPYEMVTSLNRQRITPNPNPTSSKKPQTRCTRMRMNPLEEAKERGYLASCSTRLRYWGRMAATRPT